MNNAITTYEWLAIFLATGLWVVLAYAELRRYGKTRRGCIRIALLFLAVIALVLVLLKPTYKAKGASTILLLNGGAAQQLDSLLEVYPAATVLSLQPHKEYQQLEGLSYLHRYAARGSQVFLLGAPPVEMDPASLKNFWLQYLPGPSAAGLKQLHYRDKIRMTDSMVVEGHWLPQNTAAKLLLAAAGVALDSSVATKAGTQFYRLSAPALVGGSQLYQLFTIGKEGDTLQTYRLPLQVQERNAHQLALLTAFPEPESKYLKEFLGNQGYGLQYEAALSPTKQIQEWINLPRRAFQYTPKALSTWDAVLLSASQWNALANRRQEALSTNMQQTGSGLLIYADGEQEHIRWQGSSISFGQQAVKDTLLVEGVRVPLEYRPFQQLPDGWEVVLKGSKGIAAISRRHGLGKVVVTGSVDSYTLLLKGAGAAYLRYWNLILEEALPLQEKTSRWEQSLDLSMHNPANLQFQTRDSRPQPIVMDPEGKAVATTFWQDPQQPALWKTKFWPRHKGWHKAAVAGDTLQFWVAENGQSLAQALAADQLLQNINHQAPMMQIGRYERKPFPFWLYYTLFVTSMCALWLEKKING